MSATSEQNEELLARLLPEPPSVPFRQLSVVVERDGLPVQIDGFLALTSEELEQIKIDEAHAAEKAIRRRAQRSVSAAQAKLALYNAGLLDHVEAAVKTYAPMLIYFENATTWSADHPYVLGMAAELGVSDGELHELIDTASKL